MRIVTLWNFAFVNKVRQIETWFFRSKVLLSNGSVIVYSTDYLIGNLIISDTCQLYQYLFMIGIAQLKENVAK